MYIYTVLHPLVLVLGYVFAATSASAFARLPSKHDRNYGEVATDPSVGQNGDSKSPSVCIRTTPVHRQTSSLLPNNSCWFCIVLVCISQTWLAIGGSISEPNRTQWDATASSLSLCWQWGPAPLNQLAKVMMMMRGSILISPAEVPRESRRELILLAAPGVLRDVVSALGGVIRS